MAPYAKPHISYEEQVQKLAERGLRIQNFDYARNTLMHINYYRLGVYWHSFESSHDSHLFIKNTSFEDIVALYEFDRKLRLLVLDAIERIEVSFRTQWTYHMSEAYGSHAHMVDKAHSAAWHDTVKDLQKELKRSDEVFIKRLIRKYDDSSPPIWAASEIMSFGLLSRWFKNLRVNTVRKNISRMYDVHPDVLQSWMQHLTVLRNNCAHHSRLWNRQFGRVAPIIPRCHPILSSSQFSKGYPLANSLVIILYLLDIISPSHGWRTRFIDLVNSYPTVSVDDMGLPNNWQDLELWNKQ